MAMAFGSVVPLPLLAAALVALLAVAVTRLWDSTVVRLVWRPYAIAKELRAQGIHGPRYKLGKGCNDDIKAMKAAAEALVFDVHDHNYLPRIAPHYVRWRAQYGEPFVYWFGARPHICIFDYELARQILSTKSGHFVRNDPPPVLLDAVGMGLALLDGVDWVRHHRVIKPAFAMDKLKMMTQKMVACAEAMIKELEEQASKETNGEIEVDFDKQFRELTADVIAHAAFGSSFELGKEVFQTQHDLVAINTASLFDVHIPGLKYLPTETNRRKRMLEKKLRSSLLRIIEPRLASAAATASRDSASGGDDLLGLMLESCAAPDQHAGKQGGHLSLSIDEIIDECKLFFFAGHDTTSLLLTWAVFLLSAYPEWQERLRREVLTEIGRERPSADDLGKLKEMTMVLFETLRLYTPVLYPQRKPIADITVGSTKLPRGVAVVIPIPLMHRDERIWGDDAGQFNPLRFQNGITRAGKVPHAMLAFSMGPRSCIGQNLAMLEAKSALALMLQRFSFALSPAYVHAPTDVFSLKPKFGLPVVLRRLDACC